jgi:hypothetical protein
LLDTIDNIIIEGQKKGMIDSSLKPQVLRQMLGGTSQNLFSGLFLQYYREEIIGYDERDIGNAIVTLIKKFTIQ